MNLRPSLSGPEKRALLASLLRERAGQGEAAETRLSHGQRALWLLHERSPESAAYNTAFAIRLRSPVDTQALAASLQAVVDRHDALRTVFGERDGSPVARTLPRAMVRLDEVDARGWSGDELHRRVGEDYRRPFDLRRGPLFRATLFSGAPGGQVLLLAVHHIVCDAWSFWVLMDELGARYAALLAGDRGTSGARLAASGPRYADFVAWQDRLLTGPEGERLWAYWRGALAGDLPVLDLPTDRPRPAVRSDRGASHTFTIDETTTRQLHLLGQAEGVTLFMTLLALFQVLLHRYTGQDDLVVGSPAAGRNNPDFASCVGYFANPLPLRADLSGDPAFRAFLTRVRGTVLGALAHQDIPFPTLIERLQPPRDPSRQPVVEALFVLQRPPPSTAFDAFGGGAGPQATWGGDLPVEPFPVSQMEGQFDLTWEVVEDPRSLACVLKYSPDLFEPGTVARMEGHLRTLIAAVIRDPDQRIGRLPLTTTKEAAELRHGWQGKEVAYPLERCVHDWVADQAVRSPDSIAVVVADGSGGDLTWRALNERANQLARLLRRKGVSTGSVVGVLIERSLDLVVALLGILKAGAAYLPLEPGLPRERLAFMADDAEIDALVTGGMPADLRASFSCTVLQTDADRSALDREDLTDPRVAVTSDGIAYVIYTSGSTGRPKAVENTHRGLCNRLLWMQDEFRLDASDRVLQKTPFGFDVSVWEFFWPLMTGAQLVLCRPGGHRDRDHLVDTIARHRVTTVHFVPSMLQLFLDAPELDRCRTSLRRVLCSGEVLPLALQERFFERLDVPLHNLYGPTEAAIDVTHWACRRDPGQRTVPIGRPIANTSIHLLDRHGAPVPIGIPGELHIGGVGVARGYRNRPELTAERFVTDPFGGGPTARLYRTGDLCRRLPDGCIEYLQRLDTQVKLRGFRIELGEIEAALCTHPQIREAVVGLDGSGVDARLVAWIVLRAGADLQEGELARFLGERLPDYMVPARSVVLERLPLTGSGKVDRKALAVPLAGDAARAAAPLTEVQRRIAAIWAAVLGREVPGTEVNFFDLGGHSLLLAQVQARLAESFGRAPAMVDLFHLTTIEALARFYAVVPSVAPAPARNAVPATVRNRAGDVAIVGMAGRFPGAADVDAFWRNICAGVESISRFSDAELEAAGVPEALRRDPAFVPAFGALAGVDEFDAGLFGMTPREAELTDVQHRLLLECAWEAIEASGHDPTAETGRYGVFAGIGLNRYLLGHLMPNPDVIAEADPYALMLGNDKDFAPTRVSYKLDLKGPSVSVQTACSTSLVAVHMARRSLLAGECDVALAGGCSVTLPQDRGYLYRDGMILSPDGHCRAFDTAAQGTVGGNAVALVVLRRLADAVADGDRIHAVITGSAINNDGAAKAGYTAPGIDGQAAVIAGALAEAGIGADAIGYVEAHGTGTPLGDPIEVAALTRVFKATGAPPGSCALGSVKTNVGHLDAAAGVTGLVKAALAVRDGVRPASLHFRTASPALDLSAGPFFVPIVAAPWPAGETPRRAGTSSFGIGGTNAHVVVEQPPEPAPSGPGREVQLLVLSADEPRALDACAARLAQRLRDDPGIDLADAAFTLAVGRRAQRSRRALVCRTASGAADLLESPAEAQNVAARPSIAFMFSGQGSQHAGMAAGLYGAEPTFRAEVDRCADIVASLGGPDLRAVFDRRSGDAGSEDERLRRTEAAQPALFTLEYALARLWMSWGVVPEALIGHSLGEYVAACLAGIWSLEDALGLVVTRAAAMGRQPPGCMLAVSCSEHGLRARLPAGLDLAAVNGAAQCVVSGPAEAIARLGSQLAADGVACRTLPTSHAFHSASMEPAVEPLLARLRATSCRSPTIPLVSNVTGTWMEPGQACDPAYWARQMRGTVRFADGLATLLGEPELFLLEIGPGNALATLALRHPAWSPSHRTVASLPRAGRTDSDVANLLGAAGQLWCAGARLDWPAVYAGQRRRRLALPTYPFQRRRYWITPPRPEDAGGASDASRSDTRRGVRDEGARPYVPSWQRMPEITAMPRAGAHWLLLVDEGGTGTALSAHLANLGVRTTIGRVGAGFAHEPDGTYRLDPGSQSDHRRLVDDLRRSNRWPDVVVHLWNVDATPEPASRDRSFHSLVFLAQALGEGGSGEPTRCHIAVVARGLSKVVGTEATEPGKALLLGPAAVIPLEYEGLTCGVIDLDPASSRSDRDIARLAADVAAPHGAALAYRGGYRWSELYLPTPLPSGSAPRPERTWMIVGGMGGVGVGLAEWLAKHKPGVKLALASRAAVVGSGSATAADHGAIGRLKQLGAEVIALACDVTDRDQVRRAVEAARERLGPIDGVIHAAGVASGGTIAIRKGADAERELAAKVEGTVALMEALADAPPATVVLCSSLSAVIGGLGQVGYCAANAFQDAFATARDGGTTGSRIVAIGWDRWRGVGMAAALEARYRDLTGEELQGGMDPAEAGEIFGRILAGDAGPRVVVSARDLPAVVAEARAGRPTRVEVSPRPAILHPRPSFAGAYVAPAGETERAIAACWQEELGIEQVGAQDDFFVLGGDSLIAIKLASRLRRVLEVPFEARAFYDAPTVAALAERVTFQRWATEGDEVTGEAEEGVL